MVSNAARTLGRWNDCDSLEARLVSHQGKAYLDIGAFVGLCVSVMAQHGVEIDAFEIAPHTHRCLAQTVGTLTPAQQARTTLHAVGLGSKPDTVSMNILPGHQGGNSVDLSGTTAGRTEVQIVTYDGEMKGDKVYDVVKIDVEGFECHVVCGARGAIARGKWTFLQVEFAHGLLVTYGCSFERLRRMLLGLGFKSLGPTMVETWWTGRVQLLDFMFEWDAERVDLSEMDALCDFSQSIYTSNWNPQLVM
jgi:FkbM family methyltransferase